MKTVEESLDHAEKTLRAVSSKLEQSTRDHREEVRQARDAIDAARARGALSPNEISEAEAILDALCEAPPHGPPQRPLPRPNKAQNVSWLRI